MQPVVLGLCPKRKNHPLCGWIFIGLYGDNRTRSAMHYGFAEAKFLRGKNERSLERTKISGTVTTVDTTNVDILNFLCYT